MLRSPISSHPHVNGCRIATFSLALFLSLAVTLCGSAGVARADDSAIHVGVIDRYTWENSGTATDLTSSLLDQYNTVCVWLDTLSQPAIPIRAFEFVLCYDAEILDFISADRGSDLPAEWDYFSYRAGQADSGCVTCPSGTVRLIGVANLSGDGSPALPLGGCFAELQFYVGIDYAFLSQCADIGFCSFECGDNVITSANGDSLFLPETGSTLGPDYDTAACLQFSGGEPEPVSTVAYSGGAICIQDPSFTGDLNLNGFPRDIGDAILYSNYFVYGPSVWDPIWADVQIQASDINNDGLTLTVADLYYLIRVITGDASWQESTPKRHELDGPATAVARAEVSSRQAPNAVTVQMDSPVDVGSVFLRYRYAGVSPEAPNAALPDGMTLRSRAHDGELRITIHPDIEEPGYGFAAGEIDLVTIPISGRGNIELVEVQFSDTEGNVLIADVAKAGIPDRFALHQNYPNPFNAATVIPYSLTEDLHVTLEIFDVLGRVVARPVDEFQAAGDYRISWDGADAPSGMYFYRLRIGDFTQTRQMVLLK
jgi:hypothetical protein